MNTKPDPTLPGKVQVRLLGRQFSISRFTFLLLLGAIVGALTGLVTVAFREAALLGHRYIFPFHYEEGQVRIFTWAAVSRLVMPALGGLFTGLVLYKLWRFTGSHAIPAILRAVASGRHQFGTKMAVPPALAIVTIATGGSTGAEGPIAEIGAVMGSQIGRAAKVPPRMMKTLIGSGVAAGVAAMFNAPIGGVFFAIEVILRNYEVASFTPIVVAAVVGSVIAHSLLGTGRMALAIPPLEVPTGELPYYVILGLLCGGLAILYIYTLDWCRDKFQRLHAPLWVKPAAGGLGVGIVGIFMPFVMGDGYPWIQQVIDGEGNPYTRMAGLLVVVMLLKIVVTGMTVGSGNPGGAFAPAVFVGVMGGAAYGVVLQQMGLVADATPFAVMGMAGLIAGALGAPITGIMIALGFGGSASIEILLALMTTVALCMFVMQFWKNVSVYTLEFVRLGIDLDRAGSDPLSLIPVKSVMQTTGYEELPSRLAAHDALAKMKESTARWFVVRDEHYQFVGIVTLHEMRMAIAEEELSHVLVLGDITDAFQPRLEPEMTLKEALASFHRGDAEVLPVCEAGGADGKLIGILSRQDALNAYSEFAAAKDEFV